MKPTEAEFSELYEALSQSTIDELTACPIHGLGAFFIELKVMRGFAASRLSKEWGQNLPLLGGLYIN
jgi:hypothetical protein